MSTIRLASTLVPGGSTFPIAYQDDIQGGLHTVKTYDALDTLVKKNKAQVGMLVKVLDEDKYYEYKQNGTWEELKTSASEVSESVMNVIRALQTEIAKLRNSFKYGINSYQGQDTAQGEVVNGMLEVDDKEPLWAVDEDDVEYATDIATTLDKSTKIQSDASEFDVTTEGVLGIVKGHYDVYDHPVITIYSNRGKIL